MLEAVMDDPDFEWLMIDASYIKAHPHSAGAGAEARASPAQKGAEQQAAPQPTPGQALAVDSHGMPVRLAVTGARRPTALWRCP